jgi:AcrR family transcriptional regulator
MTQDTDAPMTATPAEPLWKQRAVERSTRAAKLRAEQRVQRFLDAAQVIITDKGSTDFTVQEVVDRSRQSLRSFYQHFDGKHELLLALFEDALRRATVQIAAAAASQGDPVAALKSAVQLLFELSRPEPAARRPLFADFAPQLLLTHPAEVARAHAPLLELLTGLTARAAAAGRLRPGTEPRRAAALTMQTVMFIAQASGGGGLADGGLDGTASGRAAYRPITANEIWDFCAHGVVSDLTSRLLSNLPRGPTRTPYPRAPRTRAHCRARTCRAAPRRTSRRPRRPGM